MEQICLNEEKTHVLSNILYHYLFMLVHYIGIW